MTERVEVCRDVQTEHLLCSQSLNVGRVNHILRVHGDRVAHTSAALPMFDEAMQRAMSRLFPGIG
eukprot:11644241-Prorocentrum_lima.AAC.1